MKTVLSMLIMSMAASAHGTVVHTIEEFCETSKERPFSITQVEAAPGELRLFVESGYIAAIPEMLRDGSLKAQLSDGGSGVAVPLSLGKSVRCGGETLRVGYSDPLPDCAIEQIRYFLRTPATLGRGRDLAVGIDPDFLWIVEER